MIYLARRNSALTREQFIPRWRQHGALAMTMPRWEAVRLYGQSEIVIPPQPIPGIAADADGVGMIWFRDAEARARNRGDMRSKAIMEADQLETFDRLVTDFALVAKEVVVKRGPRPPFKLMSFLKRTGAMDRDRFERTLIDDYAPALLAERFGTSGGIVRYVQNLTDPQIPHGLKVDAIEELWFESAHDPLAAAAPFVAFANHQSADIVAERTTYLAGEIILYDKP